jgi:hypothetical protein
MKNKLLILVTLIIISINTFAQSKMIVGQNHTILAEIPNNWIQAENDKLSFFIKPDETNVSPWTYMYVYGIDYDIKPEIEKWIDDNSKNLKLNFPEVIIGKINLDFKNLKDSKYYTGKNQVVTYEYADKRKECLLIIECKNSIITVVLSAENDKKFNEYLKAFSKLGNSIKITATEIKRE